MNNTYGTKKPANITSSDIDIFYHYRPSRSTDASNFDGFKKLDSNILTKTSYTTDDNNETLLSGMYNLRLPIDTFNKKGIYTIYIKPKEIKTQILDVSTLAAFPNVRGVVISINDENLNVNGNLVGYRIEYEDENQERIEDFRIITSSNRCEPVSQNMNDAYQKGVRYRFNDSSSLLFCTLTPSTGNNFKSNSEPYIGKTGQTIYLVNTKFNPIAIEIEMVEHDDETISTMLEGDQMRNLDLGLITTFNSEGEVYNQVKTGSFVDPDNGYAHDFKVNNVDNIDFNENIENVKNSL